MLHPVDAGLDRVGDGHGGVRVRGDRQPEPVRLVDGVAQHPGRELGQVLAGAGGQVPAAGHDLDDVGAAGDVLSDGGADALGGRRRLPAQVVTVAAGRGDGRPGREDGGQAGLAAQAQGQVAAVAEVADGGDPAAQGGLARPGHGLDDLAVGPAGQVRDRLGAGVEGQVDVRVDQPGQQGGPGQVDHLGVRRDRAAGFDAADDAALDHQHRVADQRGVHAVEQPGGTQGRRPGLCHRIVPSGLLRTTAAHRGESGIKTR